MDKSINGLLGIVLMVSKNAFDFKLKLFITNLKSKLLIYLASLSNGLI